MSPAEKAVIGWREWIALPQLGIKAIKAKIDTGARTSALHAYDLFYFERRGVAMVRFCVHPMQRNKTQSIAAEAPVIDLRRVRSSSGHADARPVVMTEMELMGQRRLIEVTLTNRDEMGFRMLIGREALRGLFVVDPARSFRATRPKRKKVRLKKRPTKKKSTKRISSS
ncbi:MAG: ATP-dependent zinc protease [Planctomycetes bacterium]|nr:ATP-dependent zinc protease [Planctomycetota bacterium]